MKKLGEDVREQINEVIKAHKPELESIRGFVAAEPGFRTVNGWIRREPAIIVLVREKLRADALLSDEFAPHALGGFRVDIVPADPWQLLGVDEEHAGLLDQYEVAAASTTYQPRPGNPVNQRFTVNRPMLCHVGPDAGWPTLKRFLEGARDTLSVAMYDINARHVVKSLIDVTRLNDLKFTLVWDSGMTGDEPEMRENLKDKLSTKLDAWVVRTGGGYRFDSAYHSKVAVRDSRSFWLSSGNWSKRSQPDIDPVSDPASAPGMYSKGNREWHIIVDDEPLARMFEDYILYDRDQSEEEDTALSAFDPMMLPDLFVPIEALLDDGSAALAIARPFAPRQLPSSRRSFDIQPVLCPDNYIAQITQLVKSARASLYLQFSYITYSTAARDVDFQALLDYIGELSHKPDFDLKIIVGNNSAQEKVRKLVEAGFNERCIRVQSNIHNKAIIVDGKVVLVSSANWSSAGALRNRDAGIIIYEPEVANYYLEIFLDDWDERARSDFDQQYPARLAHEGEPTPPGMARVRWVDYLQED